MLSYAKQRKLFYWSGAPEKAIKAGLQWFERGNCYATPSPYLALKLYPYSDMLARPFLDKIVSNIALSGAEQSSCKYPIPVPEGEAYLPYQDAGIRYMGHQLRNGLPAVMCADEPGLGKTIQGIGVANYCGHERILVVGPASLRLNWLRELMTWHVYNQGIRVISSGKDEPVEGKSHIVSYELAHRVQGIRHDLVIVDEAHKLGNPQTRRTRITIGSRRNNRGLVHKTPAVFLGGTPFPNGKPHQGYPVLSQCVPQVVDSMNSFQFMEQFCTYIVDDDGEYYVTGSKNEQELYVRLRGSGFMLRRLKRDVLKDLPPIWYKLVVLPSTGATAQVVDKERPFIEREIRPLGILPGEASPELRREMGEAMLPQCVEYTRNLLDSGVEKVLVGVYHKSVAAMAKEGLQAYCPLVVTGDTPMHKRQGIVDQFQERSENRVFIGNMEAAGVGYTLTRARDAILYEPSYVPGDNSQFIERTHRVGQKYNVTAHLMVAENSMGARILASAARKMNNASAITDNERIK